MKKTSQDLPAPAALLIILTGLVTAGWQIVGFIRHLADLIPPFSSPYEAIMH